MVTYLLPSWAYTASQPEAARNIVDLLIFCEQPFCALLPPSCRQLVSDSGALSPAPVLFLTTARITGLTCTSSHLALTCQRLCVHQIAARCSVWICAGQLAEHDNVANCWWHPVSDGVLGEWQENQQMVPIAVLLEAPFPEVAQR